MKFKISFTFPVIVIILSIISVVFLTEIEPFNYVVAAVVFVIALAMAWRIYYDFTSEREQVKEQTEYQPSAKITGVLKESPKESKMKLDDFLKSSPKSMQSKDFDKEFDFSLDEKADLKEENPFTSDGGASDQKYKLMKQEALKELKDVIKPKKPKKKEE
ncbi:MAG: hypothetical protein COT90_04415 [Candidatus Diapherotrites archaeon CG10_big_fil_rev_8_21_14_0_10_31_34]|nr:MAG: hypothetical protein COT90_04415 [Candidatus Diapherotrites archaeon CG10_big_fil_rev_8_21_14_0_10_31_34]